MDREAILARALKAAGRAEVLAEHAGSAAHADNPNRRHTTAQFAAAAAAWADASRALAAIARVLPEPAADEKTEA